MASIASLGINLGVDMGAIQDRHGAEVVIEAVIEALYHHLNTLARQEPDGVRFKAAQELTTLAGRLWAVLDRTPEYYQWAKPEQMPVARFPYEPDEITPERAVDITRSSVIEVGGFLLGEAVHRAANSEVALGKMMSLANTDEAHERRTKRERAEAGAGQEKKRYDGN